MTLFTGGGRVSWALLPRAYFFITLLLVLEVALNSDRLFVSAQFNPMLSIYNAIRAGGFPEDKRPYFDNTRPTKIVAEVGSTAKLSCKVVNLFNHTVSWIRHEDLRILAVGPYTYINDDRYVPICKPFYDEFQLHIKLVRPEDAGVYECQISSEPVSAFHIKLDVIAPKTQKAARKPTEDAVVVSDLNVPSVMIQGGVDQYVAQGALINLTCVVLRSRVDSIFWYHEDKVISYYSRREGRGGVSVINEKSDHSYASYLLIRDAYAGDAGVYTCSLSNSAIEAKARLFVLKEGESPPELRTEALANSASELLLHFFPVTFLFTFIGHLYHVEAAMVK